MPKMSRGLQWRIWHEQLEAKVRAGFYSQAEADDLWLTLHEVMSGPRGTLYQQE
jgi:hypothetical protein